MKFKRAWWQWCGCWWHAVTMVHACSILRMHMICLATGVLYRLGCISHTYSMLIALVARHTILGSVRCYETWAFLAFLLLHWYTCRMEHVNVSVTLHFANLDWFLQEPLSSSCANSKVNHNRREGNYNDCAVSTARDGTILIRLDNCFLAMCFYDSISCESFDSARVGRLGFGWLTCFEIMNG